MMERLPVLVPSTQYRPIRPRDVPPEQAAIAQMIRAGQFEMAAKASPEDLTRFSETLGGAVPYLWSEDIRRTARAANLPKHIVGGGQTPHRVMWWSWEVDVPLSFSDGTHEDAIGVGLLIIDHGQALELVNIARRAADDGPVLSSLHVTGRRIHYGSRYPDDVPAGMEREVLALLAFLNSPYVESVRTSTRPHNKAQARRIQRPTPAVQVVRLRASVHDSVKSESDGDAGLTYRVKWMVRGHYRAQWYPSTESHRVIWIAPYIKGPEDAPLKVPVFVVDR